MSLPGGCCKRIPKTIYFGLCILSWSALHLMTRLLPGPICWTFTILLIGHLGVGSWRSVLAISPPLLIRDLLCRNSWIPVCRSISTGHKYLLALQRISVIMIRLSQN